MQRLTRAFQYGVIFAARVCAWVLKLVKYNTQEIVESLWIFRAALGQIVPDGLVVDAQGAKFRIQNRDLMNLKIALVGAHEFDVTGFVRRNVSADTKGAFIDVGANIGYYSVIVGC